MEKEINSRVYEISYLIVPSVSEEDLGKEVTILKDAITSAGGAFIAEEFPKFMELAYQMERTIQNKKQKFNNGYFGWFKFDLPQDAALALDVAFDTNVNIIRHLFIKTVRENTLVGKRVVREVKKKVEHTDAPLVAKEESTPEEIDKQIDALVTE